MPQRVLNEDWSEYDNRKIRDRRDAKDFACSEAWEVDFLVRKIRNAYPMYSEAAIRGAISTCCLMTRAPHPRQAFVACVMQRLRS